MSSRPASGRAPTGKRTTGPTITPEQRREDPSPRFGVSQAVHEETMAAVTSAPEVGYRHIDTAASYAKEREVGDAMRCSGIARESCSSRPRYGPATTDTTKRCTLSTRAPESSWSTRSTCSSCTSPCRKISSSPLGPSALSSSCSCRWTRLRSAPNVVPEHLARLLVETSIVPAANQVEVHPPY